MLGRFTKGTKIMRKGIMSLENLDEPEVVEAEVTDFVDAPENDLADAAESEGELAEVNDGIEEAGETGETLEGIHEAMGESLEEGGMPEPEARALEVAVEHICARIGFSKRKRVFPAMEGFKEKGADRIRDTKLAMEEVGERIKAIWAAVMAALAKAWEHVKAFFKSLVDGAARLKTRAETLEAQAKKTSSGHGAEGKKISTGSFGKFLTVGGKLLTDGALVSAYETHAKDAFITTNRTDIISKVAPKIEALVAKEKVTEEEVNEVKKELADTFAGLTQKGLYEKVHALTFGGAEFVWSDEPASAIKVFIKTPEKEAAIPAEVEALTSLDSEKLAGAVAKRLDSYAKSATSVGEAINKISALVSKLKNGKSDDPSSAKYAGICLRALNQTVNQSSVILKGYDVKVAKAALDYVGASLSGLKQEKAAPAAAPAK